MARAVGLLAGVFALASGVAYLAYWPILRQPDWAVTAWNLLIIPTALYLGIRVTPRGPMLAALSTAAGIAGSLLWAAGFRDPALEPWWIGLAAVWWLGLGRLLLLGHRATALLTLVLGVAAGIDFVLTLLEVGMPLLAVGGLKLPLSTLWSLWVGVVLIRDPVPDDGRLPLPDAARPMALFGGLMWVAGGVGWLLTHGTTASNPSAAELLALHGTQFTQLQAVAALFWVVALAGLRPTIGADALARVAWAIAAIGAVIVGSGAFLETSVVDPDRNFLHPAVQGGWLLFISGLPVMGLGLIGLAAAARDPAAVRTAYAVAGCLAPLPVVAFIIGSIATRGPGAVATLAALHASAGIGWVGLSLALGVETGNAAVEESMPAA